MRKVIAFLLVFNGSLLAQHTGEKEKINRLPGELLAFPQFSSAYRYIISRRLSGKFKVYSEKYIQSWALSQGFAVTGDQPFSPAIPGYEDQRFRRGIIFHSPGLLFQLQVSPDDLGHLPRFGWVLELDMGFLKPAFKSRFLSTRFENYQNMLRYEIWVDGILYEEIEIGFGKTRKPLVRIDVPFIRDPDGKVNIEIRLANHPANFGILYDARLVRKKN